MDKCLACTATNSGSLAASDCQDYSGQDQQRRFFAANCSNVWGAFLMSFWKVSVTAFCELITSHVVIQNKNRKQEQKNILKMVA